MLDTLLILAGYAHGIFPMAVNSRGDIAWFSPDPRAIIPLDDRFHIPHGLRRVLRKGTFQITVDQDFPAVIRACANSHGNTWISRQIIESYCALHQEGHAHSVEARLDGLPALRALYSPMQGKFHVDRWEMINPRVIVSGDMGVLTFNFVTYSKGRTERWNTTEVYRRKNGQWKIVHTHWAQTKPQLVKPPATDK